MSVNSTYLVLVLEKPRLLFKGWFSLYLYVLFFPA